MIANCSMVIRNGNPARASAYRTDTPELLFLFLIPAGDPHTHAPAIPANAMCSIEIL